MLGGVVVIGFGFLPIEKLIGLFALFCCFCYFLVFSGLLCTWLLRVYYAPYKGDYP
jgi:hypothetical protein